MLPSSSVDMHAYMLDVKVKRNSMATWPIPDALISGRKQEKENVGSRELAPVFLQQKGVWLWRSGYGEILIRPSSANAQMCGSLVEVASPREYRQPLQLTLLL